MDKSFAEISASSHFGEIKYCFIAYSIVCTVGILGGVKMLQSGGALCRHIEMHEM